tara:strand:+ start:798 stop:920 length:123 start_codon:yes stop_codon:yes gene_type:complete
MFRMWIAILVTVSLLFIFATMGPHYTLPDEAFIGNKILEK